MKFTLQTIMSRYETMMIPGYKSDRADTWRISSYNHYMPNTTELSDIIKWLDILGTTGIEGPNGILQAAKTRKYQLLVDGIPLAAFDLDNLWILESYL